MTRKVLFIHIPKTAGSTLKVFFRDTLDDFCIQANSADQLTQQDSRMVRVRDMADLRRVMSAHGGLALHVDSNFDEVRRTTDFRSLAGLLFEPEHYDYFAQFTIVTMFRHPFKRLLSEYAFVRRMQESNRGFLPDLDVSTVEAFLARKHPNSVLHFLLERDLANPRIITSGDLERVKERIAGYPIHVGIHERFDESIAAFARALGRQFKAGDLPVLNATKPLPVNPALEAEFLTRNELDMELYEYAARRLDARASS